MAKFMNPTEYSLDADPIMESIHKHQSRRADELYGRLAERWFSGFELTEQMSCLKKAEFKKYVAYRNLPPEKFAKVEHSKRDILFNRLRQLPKQLGFLVVDDFFSAYCLASDEGRSSLYDSYASESNENILKKRLSNTKGDWFRLAVLTLTDSPEIFEKAVNFLYARAVAAKEWSEVELPSSDYQMHGREVAERVHHMVVRDPWQEMVDNHTVQTQYAFVQDKHHYFFRFSSSSYLRLMGIEYKYEYLDVSNLVWRQSGKADRSILRSSSPIDKEVRDSILFGGDYDVGNYGVDPGFYIYIVVLIYDPRKNLLRSNVDSYQINSKDGDLVEVFEKAFVTSALRVKRLPDGHYYPLDPCGGADYTGIGSFKPKTEKKYLRWYKQAAKLSAQGDNKTTTEIAKLIAKKEKQGSYANIRDVLSRTDYRNYFFTIHKVRFPQPSAEPVSDY